MILCGRNTFSSEIICIYFHQKDGNYYNETIGQIKNIITTIITKLFYYDIKYVYTDCTNELNKVQGISIDDTQKIKPKHRLSVVIICRGFAAALLGWSLIRNFPLKKKYKSAVKIVKPELIFRDYVSMIEDFTKFYRGMANELLLNTNEEKLRKTINKYKDKPLNKKRYKKAVSILHYDGGLSKNPHTAWTSLV